MDVTKHTVYFILTLLTLCLKLFLKLLTLSQPGSAVKPLPQAFVVLRQCVKLCLKPFKIEFAISAG